MKLPGAPSVSYVHTSLAHPHLIMDNHTFPETMWTALAEKPLTQLVDLPFAHQWIIVMSQFRQAHLAVYRDILIQPLD